MAVQPQQQHYLSPEEYLLIERQAEYKSEYFNGEMFAMAGASRKHNLIVTNLVGELHQQLKQGNCNVYSNDMRVKVRSTGMYTYPDVVVGCGDEQFEDDELDTLLTPILIIEVLSKSTQGYDRVSKFAHYRRLDSLLEYMLVAQQECLIEHYVRQADSTWLLSEKRDTSGIIRLPSIACRLRVEDIYTNIEFENA